MTDVLKAEMARTNKARRATAVARLAEYAKMSAAQARQVRGDERWTQQAGRAGPRH